MKRVNKGKRVWRAIALGLLSLTLAFAAAGCASEKGTEPTDVTPTLDLPIECDKDLQNYAMQLKSGNAAEVDTYATDLHAVATSNVEGAEEQQAAQKINAQTIEGKKLVYKKRSAHYGIENIAMFGANDNITYAGALLGVNRNGTEIKPLIGLKRKPLTLSIDAEGTTGIDYKSSRAQAVVLSDVRSAIHQLVKGVTGDTAELSGVATMMLVEIKASEEINMALGMSFGVGSVFNMNASFDFSSKGEQTYAMLLLKQVYYTISVDYDATYGAYSLLDNSVTKAQLQDACGENYAPVYVSSVSYGRLAAIAIKTDMKMNALQACLGLEGKLGVYEAATNTRLEKMQNLSKLSCDYFLYGGAASEQSSIMRAKSVGDLLDALNQPYAASKQVGKPIFYRLSHLADNALAKIGYVGDYYYAEYENVAPSLAAGKVDSLQASFHFNDPLRVDDGDNVFDKGGAYCISRNEHLQVDISSLDLEYIKDIQKNVLLQIEFYAREENRGYQQVYVYRAGVQATEAQNNTAHRIASAEFEHSGNKKDTSYKKYRLTAIVTPDSVNTNALWIAFDARGDKEDTWWVQDIQVRVGKTDGSPTSMTVAVI